MKWKHGGPPIDGRSQGQRRRYGTGRAEPLTAAGQRGVRELSPVYLALCPTRRRPRRPGDELDAGYTGYARTSMAAARGRCVRTALRQRRTRGRHVSGVNASTSTIVAGDLAGRRRMVK